MKILAPDFNLDQVGVGEYVATLKGDAYVLVVKAAVDASGRGFTLQTLTKVSDGSELFRAKYGKGWTNWLKRLDGRALDDVLSHVNRTAVGIDVATDHVDGLMSAADKAKLDKLPPDADKTPDIGTLLESVVGDMANHVRGYAAPKDHAHDEYVTRDELAKVVADLLPTDKFTTAEIMKLIHAALGDYALSHFKGLEKLAKKEDITPAKIRQAVGEVDAARLGGKSASAFALKDHSHDEYQKRPRIGAGKHSSRLVSSGSFIPNQENSRVEHYTNGGDHFFEAPQVTTDMRVYIVNGPKAGVVTFKGFSEVIDNLPSKPGMTFLVHVVKVGPHASADVRVLRTGDE